MISRIKNVCFSLLTLLLLGLCVPSTNVWANELTDSVVKIFVTVNRMDYYRPWQSHGVTSTGGSGAIIKGNKILTNAHVVSDNTFIQVKKHGDPKKYTAKLEAIGNDCDLALLTVEDDNFFVGTKPLKFGTLPKLQDTVTVLGYPQGGEKLSLTEGIVSRIEISSYSQSSRKLLAVQIDAAINPGNSGGPVMLDGKMVGIAMQVYSTGQNIGYMIPIPIVNHFFKDLEDGTYDGFSMVGINFMNTENMNLRRYHKIENEEGGVVVTKIIPFAPADGELMQDDIILEIDGIPIGQDGTFKFRDNERLAMPHLITTKHLGDTVKFTVMRKGKKEKISVTLTDFVPLVPHPKYFKKPTYYIYGGLVFTVLSTDLLKTWGKSWWKVAPINLTYYLVGAGRLNEERVQDKVILLNVLSDDINVGYHGHGNEIITKVNDQEFDSFKDFVKLLDDAKKEDYTILESSQSVKLIIKNENIDQIDKEIRDRNNIPAQYSKDVEQWLSENK